MANVRKLLFCAFSAFLVISVYLFFPNSGHTTGDAKDNHVVKAILTPSPIIERKAMSTEEEFWKDAPKVKCPDKQWSEAELRLFATNSELLILVHNNVLNVTDFLPHHPGGEALKVAMGGNDGADQFTHYHQPSTAGMFSNFCVGTLRR